MYPSPEAWDKRGKKSARRSGPSSPYLCWRQECSYPARGPRQCSMTPSASRVIYHRAMPTDNPNPLELDLDSLYER